MYDENLTDVQIKRKKIQNEIALLKYYIFSNEVVAINIKNIK